MMKSMERREGDVADMNISVERDGLDWFKWKTMWEISKKDSVASDMEVSWVDTNLDVKVLIVVQWVGVADLISPGVVQLGVHGDNLVLLPSEVDVEGDVGSGDQVDLEVLVLVLDHSSDGDLKARSDSVWESEGSRDRLENICILWLEKNLFLPGSWLERPCLQQVWLKVKATSNQCISLLIFAIFFLICFLEFGRVNF